MADKVTPGVGRFSFGQPTAANNPYLKIIQDAGSQMEAAGTGVARVKAEVSRREATARKLVPDADFTNDAYSGVYGANAQLIQDRIDGNVEDSYDFSNANDVARFEKDVEKLKNDIAAAEPAYGTTIGKYQDLTTKNQLYLETGDIDPLNIEGLGEVEDANIREGNYKKVMLGMEIIRDNKPVYKDGKYVYKDKDGNILEDGFGNKLEFDSPLDVAMYLETNIQPNYQSAKPLSPEGVFNKKNYAVIYPSEEKALAGFTDLVKGDLNTMAARYAAYGIPGVDAKDFMKDQSADLDADGLTDYQRKYRDALMEEWRQRTEKTAAPVGSGIGIPENKRLFRNYTFESLETGVGEDDRGTTVDPDAVTYFAEEGEGATRTTEFSGYGLPKPLEVKGSIHSDGSYKIFAFGLDENNGKVKARVTYTPKEGGQLAYTTTDNSGIESDVQFADSEEGIPEGATRKPEEDKKAEAVTTDIVIGPGSEGLAKEVYRQLQSDQYISLYLSNEFKRKNQSMLERDGVQQ